MPKKPAIKKRSKRVVTRQPNPFNYATLAQMLVIPAVTVGFYFTVNWAVTGDTLKRHDQQITEEKIEREKLKVGEDEKREALRKALTDYAATTSSSINELAKTSAVQSEQIKSIGLSLERVVNGLQNIELAVHRPDKRSEGEPPEWGTMTGRAPH